MKRKVLSFPHAFCFPCRFSQYQLLSCAYNKTLDEINLRKEGFTFAQSLRGQGKVWWQASRAVDHMDLQLGSEGTRVLILTWISPSFLFLHHRGSQLMS